jgi:predicted transcriptional regulator
VSTSEHLNAEEATGATETLRAMVAQIRQLGPQGRSESARAMAAGGMPAAAIAPVLGVSVATVRRYLREGPPHFHNGRKVGQDGKTYPLRKPTDQELRYQLISRVHYLRHDEGLSIRGIVAKLRADHSDLAPSVGTVSAWLKVFTCGQCRT